MPINYDGFASFIQKKAMPSIGKTQRNKKKNKSARKARRVNRR